MTEQTPEAAATEAPTPEQQPEQPKPAETVEFWKQKAREQEGRAKSNAEAAKRLQEYEDAQKSEHQRQSDALAKAQREAAEASAEALRYKAAATHGVGADYFDLLGTGSEDEIAARAERVGAFLKAASENAEMKAELDALRAGKTAPTAQRPTASLKPGATGEQITPPEDDSYPAHWLPQRQQGT